MQTEINSKTTPESIQHKDTDIMESHNSNPNNKEKVFKLMSKNNSRIIVQSRYKKNELDSSDICSICLTSLINKCVTHTPCEHTFHYNCIMTLYKSNTNNRYNCPLCRTNHYDSLKCFGFPQLLPLQNIEELEITNDFINSLNLVNYINLVRFGMPVVSELLVFIETVLDIIQASFSPGCFRRMIQSYPSLILTEATICENCNLNFNKILYSPNNNDSINTTSVTIDNYTFNLIHQYLETYPTIMYLINDVLSFIQYDSVDEIISYIYQENN